MLPVNKERLYFCTTNCRYLYFSLFAFSELFVCKRVKRNKSSAVAEMGDRDHNRHGPKRGGGLLCLLRR